MKKYWISLACCWLVFGGTGAVFYSLYYKLQSNVLLQMKEQIKQSSEDIALAEKAKITKTRQEGQAKLEKLSGEFSRFVIEREKLLDLTLDIGKAADNLMLSDFSSKFKSGSKVEEIAECKTTGQIWLEVGFSSDFGKFAKFINELERRTPLVYVESFKIRRSDDDENINDVDVIMSALVKTEAKEQKKEKKGA